MTQKDTKTTLKISGLIVCTLTAMVGYQIHGSIFWTVMDFIFAPLPWIKWIVFREINITVLKETFNWFLK